ncbi:MAG: NADP-specific glutamate dehydrogenase [Woeseiaceae bacterium]|jgi:glutamate dehydrogenase (NADP+)|nr:NADP-specific glutamate dehydrogenase [Woeseiaceae bacterium]
MTDRDPELENVDSFMEWLCERHPGETEFHQAVRAVATNVLDIAQENGTYRKHRVLQRLTEPDRTISFRVAWEDDEGHLNINRGYRVQLSNVIGPYKGGLRFDPAVNQSVLKFLAFEQLFKNSLTGLNLGAGKGGADFDPKERSDAEIMRFCQSFMTELSRHIGQLTDVPAGDIGVGTREIGYLFGQYRRLKNRFAGVLTGKMVGMGGSKLRIEATGYGAVYFLREMLAAAGLSIEGQRIAVSGAGNVATHAALKAETLGATVVTLSNRVGTLRKQDGFKMGDIRTIMKSYPSECTLDALAGETGAEWLDGKKPWSTECDVAMPCATQNEIDEDEAKALADGGCSFVVEGANMPLTDAAHALLRQRSVCIAPGKAANAGGVTVSGFEMAQNRSGQIWTEEQLDMRLRETMSDIYRRCCEFGQTDDGIDYSRGADRAGFERVAGALAGSGFM